MCLTLAQHCIAMRKSLPWIGNMSLQSKASYLRVSLVACVSLAPRVIPQAPGLLEKHSFTAAFFRFYLFLMKGANTFRPNRIHLL